MKWIDKLKTNQGKRIGKILIVFLILGIFFACYYFELKANLRLDGITEMNKYIKWYLFLGGSTLLISVFCIYFFGKEKIEQLHKKYFIIAISLGLCYLFLVPLFAQSDEPAHYLRAYEISNGYLTTPRIEGEAKNEFDKSIYNSIYTSEEKREYKTYEDMLNIAKIKEEKNDEKEAMNVSAANYSLINYIPHVIGIWVGRLINFNPYFCGLLGRFFSLLFCVSLVSLGIKWLPEGKSFAFILLLSPNFLSYAASFSADGTTIAYSFLFLSYLLHLIFQKKELQGREYGILIILTLCISLAKIVYLPFVFLILLLPKACFKNKKQEILIKLALIFIGVLANLGWQGILKTIASSTVTATVNVSEGNSWIFNQPIRYIVVLFNTFLQMGYAQLEQVFAGEFLCHWQVRPYAFINFGFILINLFAFLSEEKNKENTLYKTILVLGVVVIIYALIGTAMYQSETIEGANLINGIQGRYFFPIVCACLFLKVKNPIKLNKEYLTFGIVILNYLVMLTMINVFVY